MKSLTKRMKELDAIPRGGKATFLEEAHRKSEEELSRPKATAARTSPKDKSAFSATSSPSSPPLPRRLRIVVAEDDPITAAVVERHLNKLGHDVTIATDGDQAVKAAFSHRHDLVILDLHMPVLDGFEAARAIREHEKAHSRPKMSIVALSAQSPDGDEKSWRAAGIDAFLPKPVKQEELRIFLDRLLSSPPQE